MAHSISTNSCYLQNHEVFLDFSDLLYEAWHAESLDNFGRNVVRFNTFMFLHFKVTHTSDRFKC